MALRSLLAALSALASFSFFSLSDKSSSRRWMLRMKSSALLLTSGSMRACAAGGSRSKWMVAFAPSSNCLPDVMSVSAARSCFSCACRCCKASARRPFSACLISSATPGALARKLLCGGRQLERQRAGCLILRADILKLGYGFCVGLDGPAELTCSLVELSGYLRKFWCCPVCDDLCSALPGCARNGVAAARLAAGSLASRVSGWVLGLLLNAVENHVVSVANAPTERF